VSTKGLRLELQGAACGSGAEAPAPTLPSLCNLVRERTPSLAGRGGFTIEVKARFETLAAGQVLLDTRTASGKGWLLGTTDRGTVRIEMSDGWRSAHWDCDLGLLTTNRSHHLVVMVDGGPKVISFLVDGALCDGGAERLFGFGRFDPAFKDANGARSLKLAPKFHGRLELVRFYDRALRTSEAVGNYRALARP
jgi:hypothetical protein